MDILSLRYSWNDQMVTSNMSLRVWSRSKDNYGYINVWITLYVEFKIMGRNEIIDGSDIWAAPQLKFKALQPLEVA